MSKKIKQITSVLLVMLLFILLFIAILFVWDFIGNEIAKEALIKMSYTFGVIYVISLTIIFLTNRAKDEK